MALSALNALAASVGMSVPVTIQMISQHGLLPTWSDRGNGASSSSGVMWGDDHCARIALQMRRVAELKPRANALLRVVSAVFVLVFALALVWYGIRFVQFGWDQQSELAEMPMTWIFIAWPLTGVTWLLFGVERILADLRIVIDGPGPGSGIDAHREIGTGSVV
jgi:hypothetical protein